MGIRRTFTREFKVEAVKLVTDQGLGFTEAAGNFQTTNFGRGGWENDDTPRLFEAFASLRTTRLQHYRLSPA